jgi:hypothetical protein
LQAVEVLDSGELGAVIQAGGTDAGPDTSLSSLFRIVRPGSTVKDTGGVGLTGGSVPPPAFAAADDDLQNPLFAVVYLPDGLRIEKIVTRERYTEALTAAGQAMHMAPPEAGPCADHGNGLE